MSKLPDSFTKHHMHNSEEPSPNAEPEDLASKGAIRVQRRGRGREGGRGKQETREKVLVERENFCSRGKKEGKEGREGGRDRGNEPISSSPARQAAHEEFKREMEGRGVQTTP